MNNDNNNDNNTSDNNNNIIIINNISLILLISIISGKARAQERPNNNQSGVAPYFLNSRVLNKRLVLPGYSPASRRLPRAKKLQQEPEGCIYREALFFLVGR